MSVVLSCPARRQSSHYLPAEAPPCWCEVRPVAAGSALLLRSPPCCHGLRPAVESLCCTRCLGNSRLHQQWACTSVGADCLANGGHPSPTELRFQGTSPPGVFGITVLFVTLRYPKCCVPGISWTGSLSKSHLVSSSALSTHRLPVQQGSRTSALCAERCGAPLRYSAGRRHTGCQLHQPKPLLGVPHLIYTWEFSRSVGNKDPSGNATLTHPLRASTESFNPGLFSQRHLESSSLIVFLNGHKFFLSLYPCPCNGMLQIVLTTEA